MKVYKTDQIRNVVVLGHGGAGKTTLVESMAYVTGAVSRQGKVTDGTTISDFDKEETKRGFSIGTSVVPVEWEDCKINFLDTPGYFDFVGEVEEAISVADAAIIVVNGKAGVQVGVVKAWELCEKMDLPRLFFITNMDDDNASYRQVCEDLKANFGNRVAPFQMPIRENEKFVGFVNVVKMEGRKFTGEKGQFEECAIPDYLNDYLADRRGELLEAVAETSEELMERYFDGDEFTYEEISDALRVSIWDSSVVPVLMGTGINGNGTRLLMHSIVKYFQSPNKRRISGFNTKTEDVFVADYDDNKPVTAKVFKTLVDPFIGKYSLIKICSGVLRSDSTVYNVNQESEEKLSRLYVLRGKENMEVPELHAGDIGAVSKLSAAATGDTLATKAAPVTYDKPEISTPYLYMAYSAKAKGDDDKVNAALNKLMDEDKTLKVVNDSENRQSLLYGIGDQQLDTVVSKVLSRYKVDMELKKPKVPYRETIRKKAANVQGRHKKQSGGAGQFGEVFMDFEPSGDLDTAYVFEEKVVGGSVPKNFFPAVEKGVAESVLKGPLAGYPVVGIKATLMDGKYHPVDSNEMAFKMASIKAFKEGVLQASPVLLEPIASLKVLVPDKYTGDIMGDLNKRRGRVLGMNPVAGGKQEIVADIPISELYGYTTDLRSMTGGIGQFSYEFSRYEQAPGDVQQREIDARASEKEE
ncbi:MAG: elongation factor G [Lachnospiraceae bacterium]|nr:elongation factor G [Lachnospiraceae bacterium]